jgi:YVTN family beta-propeller protein
MGLVYPESNGQSLAISFKRSGGTALLLVLLLTGILTLSPIAAGEIVHEPLHVAVRPLLPTSMTPRVAHTLVLFNNSLVPGNFLAVNGLSPATAAYDSTKGEVFVTTQGTGNLSVISDVSNTVVATVPVGGITLGSAYDSVKGEIFVTDLDNSNVSVISDATNTVVATIPVGGSPYGVAYDSGKGEVFVTNSGSDSVSVISDATSKVVATVSVGVRPYGVAYDSGTGEVFVTNGGASTVSVIADSNNTVVATITVGIHPYGIAFDSGKSELYVTNYNSNNVSVISDKKNSVVNTVSVGTSPWGIACDSGMGEVFVANQGSDNVSVISDNNKKVVATILAGSSYYGVTYDSGKNEVLFTDSYSNSASVISDSTNKVVATITLGTHPYGVAYDSGKGEIFVTNRSSNNVSVISVTTNSVVTTVPVGDSPWGVAYDSGKGEIFVTDSGSGNVSVISDSNNAVVATIQVGNEPFGIAYDYARGTIFVANDGSNSVSVISDSTNSVSSTIGVGSNPFGVVYDNSKAEIFVTNLNSNNVSVINGLNNALKTSIPVGTNPNAMAYDSGKGEIFVANSGSDNVSVANDTSNKVVANVVVASNPEGIAYDPDMGEVLVANLASNSVSVINDTPNQVTATVPVGSYPTGVAYDAADDSIYVTNYGQGTISIVSFVSSPPSISSFAATPNPVTVNQSTLLIVVATGGTGALKYTYTGLPPSCASSNTNSLSCTPGSTGNFEIRVFANDTVGRSTDDSTLLIVNPVSLPTITSFTASPNPVKSGHTTYLNVTVQGGTAPLAYAYAGLPPGCATANRSSLTCVPASGGNFTIRAFVNDSAGHSANKTTTLAVNLSVSIPIISAFTASPDPITVGHTTYLNVTALGGTAPLTYAYAGLPGGCTSANTSSLSCVPTSTGTFNVTAYANDSAGHSASKSATLTVNAANVLGSVVLKPASVTLAYGGTQAFTPSLACSAGTCPSGATFSWSLTSDLATLNAATGSTVTVTAGSTTGITYLFVNATLDGVTVESSGAAITITESPTAVLASVSISPASPTLSAGGSQIFTASPKCTIGGSTASCPTGITYVWTMNSTLGSLSSSTGSSVTFATTSSVHSGLVNLQITAKLSGTVVNANTTITIVPASPNHTTPMTTFPWWIGIIVLALVLALVFYAIERRHARGLETQPAGVVEISPESGVAAGHELGPIPLSGAGGASASQVWSEDGEELPASGTVVASEKSPTTSPQDAGVVFERTLGTERSETNPYEGKVKPEDINPNVKHFDPQILQPMEMRVTKGYSTDEKESSLQTEEGGLEERMPEKPREPQKKPKSKYGFMQEKKPEEVEKDDSG